MNIPKTSFVLLTMRGAVFILLNLAIIIVTRSEYKRVQMIKLCTMARKPSNFTSRPSKLQKDPLSYQHHFAQIGSVAFYGLIHTRTVLTENVSVQWRYSLA